LRFYYTAALADVAACVIWMTSRFCC